MSSELVEAPPRQPDIDSPAPERDTNPALRDARGRVVLPHLVVVAALVGISAFVRYRGLAPSSLWLDDSWVAVTYKADSLAEMRGVGMTSPGFTVLVGTFLKLFGFSELKAQLIPFVAAILTPAAVYGVLVWRRIRPFAALAAGVVVVIAPAHAVVAVRVKPFALDGLFVVAIVATAWYLTEKPDSRRGWTALTGISVVAIMSSFATVPVILVALAVPAYACLRASRSSWKVPAIAIGSFTAFAGVWYLAFIAPAVAPWLVDFWKDFYIDTTSVATLLEDARFTSTSFAGSVSSGPAIAVWAVIALAASIVALRRAYVAALLIGPIAVAVALAVAGKAPFGGGRTDVYLIPLIALLLGVAIDAAIAATRRVPRVLVVMGATAVATLALIAFSTSDAIEAAQYPVEDTRPLIEEFENRREPDDTIVLSELANRAYVLYTSDDVNFEPRKGQWSVRRTDSDKVEILERELSDPTAYQGRAEELAESHEMFWFLASHYVPANIGLFKEHLRRAGMQEVDLITAPGAELGLWRRADAAHD